MADLQKWSHPSRYANARDIGGLTPLYYAVMNNDTDMVSFLVSHGSDVNNITRLRQAYYFLKFIGPPNGTIDPIVLSGVDGEPILIVAIEHASHEIIDILITAGADCAFQDEAQNGVLHYAVGRGDAAICEDLLGRAHVDLNQTNSHGQSPLLQAMWEKKGIPIARAFLQHGADPHVRDIFKKNALLLAIDMNLAELIPDIVAHDVGYDKPDESFGITPLMYAIRNGHCECAKELVKLGADPDWRDRSGKSVAQEAHSLGMENCLGLRDGDKEIEATYP
ncbi:ankyrin repeat domain-containing protein [Candidatus Sumerlaeota bacterium]|nr:ankyrin repeat domain-containing protein [Candidatus Sumerlaeota bacterium]